MACPEEATMHLTLDIQLVDLCQAMADDLNMLASLHNVEPDSYLLETLRFERFPSGLGLKLESGSGPSDM